MMRKLSGLLLVGLVLALGAWAFAKSRSEAAEFERLSAALDTDFITWATERRERPVLFGEAVPGEAMKCYDEAFSPLVGQRKPAGSTVIHMGQRSDQFGLRDILAAISRGARSEVAPSPALRWDGRPLDCRPWAMEQLGMQLGSDTVWASNARLAARRATPPSDGPSLMFLVEDALALLRMQDDFSRSLGGVCRRCLSDTVHSAVANLVRPLRSGRFTAAEARTLERGLVIHLSSMPSPAECFRESSLALQVRFRSAIEGGWPLENYAWGHAARGLLGSRARILAAWRALREMNEDSPDVTDPILRRAFQVCGPRNAAKEQRRQRRRYELYVLALRAYRLELEGGRYPTSLKEVVAAGGIRERPDGGRWECELLADGWEWIVWWVDADGEVDWKLGLGWGRN